MVQARPPARVRKRRCPATTLSSASSAAESVSTPGIQVPCGAPDARRAQHGLGREAGPRFSVSSRRRVTPRASRFQQRHRPLARRAERFAHVGHRHSSGLRAQQCANSCRGGVDRARREPQSVLFDHEPAAHQLAQLGAVDAEVVCARRMNGAATSAATNGWPASGSPDPASAPDRPTPTTASTDASTARSRSSSAATSSPSGPAAWTIVCNRSRVSASACSSTTQRPTVGARRSPVETVRARRRRPNLVRPPHDRPTDPAAPSTPATPAPRRAPRHRSRRSPTGRSTRARTDHPARAAAQGRCNRTRPRSPGAIASGPRMRSRTGCSPLPMYATYAPRRDTSGPTRRARTTTLETWCDATVRRARRSAPWPRRGDAHRRVDRGAVARPQRLVRLPERLQTAPPARDARRLRSRSRPRHPLRVVRR